jgi:hypothetical protein
MNRRPIEPQNRETEKWRSLRISDFFGFRTLEH